MEISNYNYGISGQPTNEWDNFLCFGRKCKQRKAERHKLRMEKRKLKNDQRRAETESMRAETSLTKQLASPTSTPTPQMAPQMMMQQAPQPTSTAQAPAPQVQKAGMGSPVMIVIGLLVVGGLVYQSMKKKEAAAPVQTA